MIFGPRKIANLIARSKDIKLKAIFEFVPPVKKTAL